MEDMLSETETADRAAALGNLLRDHKGVDVAVLDLRKMETWTDFFVIATATSNAHLDGMERHIKEFCREREIEILRRTPRKPAGMKRSMAHNSPGQAQEDTWRIIDFGDIVIHLMSKQAREFYDLERLYTMARDI